MHHVQTVIESTVVRVQCIFVFPFSCLVIRTVCSFDRLEVHSTKMFKWLKGKIVAPAIAMIFSVKQTRRDTIRVTQIPKLLAVE